MMQKTYKQIEQSRNTRLWITDVIIPVFTVTATVGAAVYNGNQDFRDKVNNLFKKKDDKVIKFPTR